MQIERPLGSVGFEGARREEERRGGFIYRLPVDTP